VLADSGRRKAVDNFAAFLSGGPEQPSPSYRKGLESAAGSTRTSHLLTRIPPKNRDQISPELTCFGVDFALQQANDNKPIYCPIFTKN
jgi:hypothetical protein